MLIFCCVEIVGGVTYGHVETHDRASLHVPRDITSQISRQICTKKRREIRVVSCKPKIICGINES